MDLFHGLYCSGSCVLVLRCGSAGWCGILMKAEALVLWFDVGVTVWFGWVVWYPYEG